MNYGFWLLMGQSAQTGVMAANLRELRGIQGQLQTQAITQAQQAALAQVLFDTEQAAQRFSAIGQQDPFAAGVMARIRLDTLPAIDAQWFHDVQSKRSWAGATDTLGRAWNAVATSSEGAQAAMVVDAVRALLRYQGTLGPDPAARQAKLESDIAAAKLAFQRGKRNIMLGLIVPPVAMVVVAGVLVKPVAVLLSMFLFFGWLAAPMSGFGARRRAKKALAELEPALATLQSQRAEFEAFLASPQGGQLLEGATRQHPALAA